ncbi:YihY/virulence factor BrkB family protein [Flavobacteriaceae bacterium TP-CH-4]|uniref:YihY/virulence factor BrkB family protein n=1 Tax=Pelagihabitans pacificus TaxID=2696054 RepID=A0A967AVJ5_9FLAO|nr:YihY/virulence factor BrkB family protein [Pelagihabitans pacificus]NHF60998.1 YihY/virulence factor BrkB family protein [Pelagihabitans pacificus]
MTDNNEFNNESRQGKGKFKLRHLPSIIAETYREWMSNSPFRLSAVVAYYAVLSLPALLIIILNSVGAIWGTEVVQGKLSDEFSMALGKDAAAAIEAMIRETQDQEKNTISTIIGIAVLLYGATGVFYQLKISLNNIWYIKPKPKVLIWKIIMDRAQSFAFILVIAFLLLTSFILTAAITALTDFISSQLPDIVLYLAYLLDFIISVAIISLLFALMFKFLPDVKIRWKTVWVGAVLTAVLFVIGKLLLSLYFGQAQPGSTYGAAGTLILILLWVSYSSLLLFFGAEFTYVFAERYGHGIRPSEIAEVDTARKQEN